MLDLLYWTTRIGLVAAWLTVAWLAWWRRPLWPRLWSASAVVAAVFASMRAWPWNYWLLITARGALQATGSYDDRLWFKVALALAVMVAIAIGWQRLRRLQLEPAALACCLGLGLQGLLLSIETLSLDDLLPRWSVQQPGRYLLEAGCVTMALLALVLADVQKRPPTS